ncbi:MAG: ATP-dependent helicase, partial [Planctomycetota bacterium]
MEFNDQQQAAIDSEAKHLLVLAGAGTGKTRTIIGRARRLLEDGCEPGRIAIVTFTRRAATEIRQRLTVGSAAGGGVVSGTFHNLCLRIMRSRRRWFDFSDLTIMDRDDQLQLMKLVRAEVVGKDATMPQSAQLLSYYSYARNTNQSPKKYLAKFSELEPKEIERVLEIFAAYKQRKDAAAYLDYDDILHRFAKTLKRSEEVRRKVCTQFDHLLVDEMQDTNPLQWLILEAFAEHCHLFCVGDDAQSIYAFRGADFENVHSFDSRLNNAVTLKLEENYRSTQEILDLSNWLLDQSSLEYGKHLRAYRGGGERPLLLDFASDFEEAAWIGETIQDQRREGIPWSDHMVLCRSAYAARPIEAEFIEQKIPYRFIGGVGLLQMAHVRDLLSLLRSVLNYRDELAWSRYLTLWPRIGEVTAAKVIRGLVDQTSLESVTRRLKDSLATRPEVTEPIAEVAQHSTQPQLAIQAAKRGLEPILQQRYPDWDNRKKDIELLERLAKSHRSLQAFVEAYTLDPISSTEARPEDNSEEGVVTLITIHSAKGTECPCCFVPSLQPGNYPHSRSLGDEEAIEEERRVLYVALTRAQDRLLLSRHLSQGYGRRSWFTAHSSEYFFEDLPAELVATSSVADSGFDLLEDDV